MGFWGSSNPVFGSGQVARLQGPWPASFSPSARRAACLPAYVYLLNSPSPEQKHPAIWRARELCQKAFDFSTTSSSRKARLQLWFPSNTRISWIRLLPPLLPPNIIRLTISLRNYCASSPVTLLSYPRNPAILHHICALIDSPARFVNP